MRLAIFADLHLDSPFAWAKRDVAKRRRGALRACLRRILNLAQEQRVDAILCAGDLYEHDRVSPDTREFLRTSFGDTPLPIYISPGNHDWYGPNSLYHQVSWSSNVHLFKTGEFQSTELAGGLCLWGAAFTGPTRCDSFFGGFRTPPGSTHVALFHGADSSSVPATASQAPHAPFESPDIERAGFQHAFVGHYHAPADQDLFTYPGNPDPLAFGETGNRGMVVAQIGSDGVISRERFSVAVSEVHDVFIDLTSCNHCDELRELISGELRHLKGVVRVTLKGELSAHIDLNLERLSSPTGDVEQIVLRSQGLQPGYDLDGLEKEPTVRGRFVSKVRADQELSEDMKARILITGLRALDGRSDLEAPP